MVNKRYQDVTVSNFQKKFKRLKLEQNRGKGEDTLKLAHRVHVNSN